MSVLLNTVEIAVNGYKSKEKLQMSNETKTKQLYRQRMNRYVVAILAVLLVCIVANAEEEGRFKYELKPNKTNLPQPPRVIPPKTTGEVGPAAPSDATVLFDGKSLDHFQESSWKIVEGVIVAGRGNLTTKKTYGDCQLHIEWRAPEKPTGPPGRMGNSGVCFMDLYELQIYDSFSSKIYVDGSAGAIFGQTPPLVNACRRPGKWQSFDVIFKAPIFKDEKLIESARITVLYNNVLVQNNTKIQSKKSHAAKGPLMIQGHHSPVQFRNIWIRELDKNAHR